MLHDQAGTAGMRRLVLRAGALSLVLTLGLGTGMAEASTSGATAIRPSPTGVSPSTWAWVVARNPTAASYTPAARDRGNSAGGVNTVTRTGNGRYMVEMPMVGTDGGMVHVTPLASTPRLCRVNSWGSVSGTEQAIVRCFTRTGSPANSAFSLNYLSVSGTSGGTPGRIGYVWANEPGTTDYTPDVFYNYNSDLSSPLNTIHRDGTGSYWVSLPGLGSSHGDVQVVGYGATVACRVVEWDPAGGAMMVHVRCRDVAGGPVDSRFDMTFVKSVALKGFNGTRSAYLWADQPTAASYHPDPAYRFSTAGIASTIKRSGKGRYTVILPGMAVGGSVQVTSYGGGKVRCIATSIRTVGLPQKIGVGCFDVAGNRANGRFTLAYAR
jgi:hypothetical protein